MNTRIDSVESSVSFLSSKKDGTNKKNTKTPAVAAAIGGAFGSLHGFYKKSDIVIGDYYIKDVAKIPFTDLNGEQPVQKIGIIPEKRTTKHPAFKRLVCKRQENGYIPVNYWQKDEAGCFIPLEMPEDSSIKETIKGADEAFYIKNNMIRMSVREDGRYALFRKVLNPFDRKIYRMFNKLPFGGKIANFIKRTKSPIETFNIGKYTFGYDITSIGKGVACGALVGLLVGFIASKVHQHNNN